jgi:hypothetical protein
MDGRGRIAQPLSFFARLRARPPTGGASARARQGPYLHHGLEPMHPSGFQRRLRRGWIRLVRIELPRGVGAAAVAALFLGTLVYGVAKGEHAPEIVALLEDTRDQVSNRLAFGSPTDVTATIS